MQRRFSPTSSCTTVSLRKRATAKRLLIVIGACDARVACPGDLPQVVLTYVNRQSHSVPFVLVIHRQTFASLCQLGEGRMGLLEGDTALITGAASGIGRGIAKALVAEGVRPVLSDIAVEASRALAREMNATFIAADLADPTARANCSMLRRNRSGLSQSWYIARHQGGERMKQP